MLKVLLDIEIGRGFPFRYQQKWLTYMKTSLLSSQSKGIISHDGIRSTEA